jgi:dTDP-4-amino-4,6-dideoxygalactose transaminase
MTDVHAAIGLEQLKKLERNNKARQENANYLSAHLKGVIVPQVPKGCVHVYHQYTLRVPDGKRDALRTYLQENGVGSEVYYPVPVHHQSFYMAELGYHLSLTEAERAALEVLSLPVHPALSQADLETIVARVNEFMGG